MAEMMRDRGRPPVWPVVGGVTVLAVLVVAVFLMAGRTDRQVSHMEEIVPTPTTGSIAPPDHGRYYPPAVEDFIYYVERGGEAAGREPGIGLERMRAALNAAVQTDVSGVRAQLQTVNRRVDELGEVDRASPQDALRVREVLLATVDLFDAIHFDRGHPTRQQVASLRDAAEAVQDEEPLEGQEERIHRFLAEADGAIRTVVPQPERPLAPPEQREIH
jgi:hypothetical protein